MLRRGLAAALLVLVGCAAEEAPTAEPSPAPQAWARNLVVISLDTLRADRLGLYGYERDTSPKLDAWSRESFVFEQAQSAANATVGAHHAIFQSRPASLAIQNAATAPTLAALLAERGYRNAGFTDGGTMARVMGFARGFERYDDGNQGLVDSRPKALAFLDEVAGGDAPFYLFVHTFDVHLPYDPPPPFDSQFREGPAGRVEGPTTLPLLRGVRRIFAQKDLAEPVVLDADERAQVNALYDGEIAKTDALLAELLARIDAPDLRDDTMVVILSDHGEEFWEHGSVLHSHQLFQELVHVPLLIRTPGGGVAPPRRVEQRVSMLDVLPTVLELLGVPAPEGMRGQSLVPLMHGEALAPKAILAEGFPFGRNQQSLIAGRYKLVRDLKTGLVELYDLDSDPGEQRDVAARYPAARDRLLEVLKQELPAPGVQLESPMDRPEDLDADTQQRLRELGYID